ncbi:hypothetical protein REPUB_Repub03eG0075700 [Reevesia pubescens]
MAEESSGEPPVIFIDEDMTERERGSKRDRKALEEITNTGYTNLSKQEPLKNAAASVIKESYRSKLLNQGSVFLDAQMEEGEIVVEDYDSEDDTTDEDLEGPCILLSKEENKQSSNYGQAVDLDNDFYCFRFSNESDFNHVLLGGPWVIANHYLTVRRWNPCFRPEEATINSVAAWIRFPGMLLEYYDNDILKRMGNLLGQTLMIDKNTLIASRGKYARLCVELDLTKPLVPRLHIGGRWQKVEYEGLGMVCFHCGCFGHSKEQCLETKGNEAVSEVEKNDDNMEVAGNPVALGQSTEKFGPWMIASKRIRKPRQDSFSKPKQHNGKKGDENQGNNITGSRYAVLVEDLDKDEGKDRVPSFSGTK